ncbi:class C sortase [Actinotignum sp. GS-2025b]|uniref:class C sortase n=1 Tax=Actinotignum sp. GS-2025b TaxID=3427275 RepID=UPI003F44E0D6
MTGETGPVRGRRALNTPTPTPAPETKSRTAPRAEPRVESNAVPKTALHVEPEPAPAAHHVEPKAQRGPAAGVARGRRAARVGEESGLASLLFYTDPKEDKRRLSPLAMILIGILCLAYPVTSTVWNNWQSKVVSRAYEGQVNTQSQELRNSYIERAHAYNASHQGMAVLDPYLDDIATDLPAYQEYARVLDQPDGIMGIVKIPKIGVKLPIYHGTSPETLQRGAGHMFGTDIPVGGINRHGVVTAHTGLPTSTMFDRLTDLGIGDEFFFEIQGQVFGYRVVRVDVVDPHDPSLLVRVPGRDLATLLTCTPYGVNSHRLLVTGERVLPDPVEVPAVDGLQWSWWMTLFVLAILISLLFAFLVARSALARRGEDSRRDMLPRHMLR